MFIFFFLCLCIYNVQFHIHWYILFCKYFPKFSFSANYFALQTIYISFSLYSVADTNRKYLSILFPVFWYWCLLLLSSLLHGRRPYCAQVFSWEGGVLAGACEYCLVLYFYLKFLSMIFKPNVIYVCLYVCVCVGACHVCECFSCC